MKDDLPPIPTRVPAKRRQLEALADIHIAIWLSDERITPSERRRLAEERQRRRSAKRTLRVGIVLGEEGYTPEQAEMLMEFIGKLPATEFLTSGNLPRALYRVVKSRDVKFSTTYLTLVEVVKASDLVLAAPRSYRPDNDVWQAVRRARARGTEVRAVMPDGRINTEGSPEDAR